MVPQKLFKSSKQKWVSIKDRLPNKTDFVLCCGDGAIRCMGYNETIKQFEDWDDRNILCLRPEYITHWMPLPKSPKEKT